MYTLTKITMETIAINKIKYINAETLKTNATEFFKGCRNARELITKKEIDDDNYIYARYDSEKNEWTESTGKSVKLDKVFLTLDYVKGNNDLWNELNTEDETKDAPDVIQLKKSEMFKDNEGNVYEIETRGVRECNGIYFRTVDVRDAFNMPNLYDVIINKESSYNENEDYLYFYVQNTKNNGTKPVKRLFLTYTGILRALFTSRTGIANRFIKWAVTTLFTVHLGTTEQKNQLVAKIKGVTAAVIREVFDKTSRDIPCIYLLSLGTVNVLREAFNIPETFNNDDLLYKFGMTNSLKRRSKEHDNDYGKIKGVKIELIRYEYIDPQYMSQAEAKLSGYFEMTKMKLIHETYKELVIISSKTLKRVKDQYASIGMEYLGHASELVNKLKEKDNEIALLKKDHENDLLKKDLEIQKLKAELESLKKDMDIQKLKHDNEKLSISKLTKKKSSK